MNRRLTLLLALLGSAAALLATASLGQAFGSPGQNTQTASGVPNAAPGPAKKGKKKAKKARKAKQRGQRGKLGPRGPSGPSGPSGPTGPQGATGPTGSTGQAGAPGLSGVQIVTADGPVVTTGLLGSSTATASCPAGKKVIGGSVDTQVAAGSITIGPFVDADRPVTTAPHGWTGTIRATVTGDWFARAYAICANAT